jgi:hypothetical protein
VKKNAKYHRETTNANLNLTPVDAFQLLLDFTLIRRQENAKSFYIVVVVAIQTTLKQLKNA